MLVSTYNRKEKREDSFSQKKGENEFLPILLITFLFVLNAGSALYINSWFAFFCAGLPILGLYTVGKLMHSRCELYYTSAASGGLCVLLIFQLPTLQFLWMSFFICNLTLTTYSNWRVFIPISLIFTVHIALSLHGDQMPSFTALGLASGYLFSLFQGFYISNNLERLKRAHFEIEERYQTQCKNLEENLNYAKEISSGNYEIAQKINSDDPLSKSLADMSESLKKAMEEDKSRNWIIAGIAKVGEIIRTSNHDMETLSNSLVSFLVKYTGATQGGIFIYNSEDDDDRFLELKGCYAYERKKYVEKKVYKGQGLIGQAVLENNIIYLTEIPQNYLQITSGLGESNPDALIIVPLKTDEEVVGALEIASFRKFEPYKIEFLEKVSETIASSFIFSKNNDKTRILLHESRELAEKLGAQEEEMRQNMEELQATQEDLQRRNIEMESAEKELLSAKEYLNSIIDAIPNPVFVKDKEHRLVVVNKAFCEFIQMPKEAVFYKSDRDLFEKEQADIFWEKDEEVFRSSELNVNEEEITGADGNRRTVITTKTTFRTPEGQPFIVGTIVDVTDKTLLAKRLNEERYLLEALMKYTTDNIYFKDLESRFIRVSDNMASIFGAKEPGELVGKSDFDFFTREHAQPAFDSEQEIIRTESPIIDLVEKETWEDGRESYVSTSKMPLKNLDGKVIGTFGISRDITSSKKVEVELIRKEKQFNVLLTASNEISIIINSAGEIKYLSPSYFKILSAQPEDLSGKSIFDFLDPGDSRILKSQIDKTLANNEQSATLNLKLNHRNRELETVASIYNYTSDEFIQGLVINLYRAKG